MSILYIQLEDLTLQFRVLTTPVADLWQERMTQRHTWPLDHPRRFYGFDSAKTEADRAVTEINRCVAIINQHQHIAHRTLTDVHDQDTLNYLHNIFEQHHGLLDQQHSKFWIYAPDHVRTAMADLNLAVHRCETAQSPPNPRLVCTWYGQPKQYTLPLAMQQQYGTVNPAWGSVCLNYCEIGKTLEDLARDNDRYIGDDAFRPFSYYSSDFSVRFFEHDATTLDNTRTSMQQYYNTHQEFFHSRGFASFNDTQLQPLRFPVAQLIETMPRAQLLQEIAARQQVSHIQIQ
jgi:hypothetical protein